MKCKKKNLAWYLLKYHIEFTDYPQNIQTIKIKTEPRGYNKIFALRDFEIFNGEKSIAKAISRWALVNKTTKAMTIIADEIPFVGKFEKRDDDLTYTKIPTLSRIDSEKHFEIRFDDIDINKHANNTNYIVWALETLDFDFRSKHTIKTIDINYKKETSLGSKIVSKVFIDNNKTYHLIKDYNTNTNKSKKQNYIKYGQL